jgi:hypothetical protein
MISFIILKGFGRRLAIKSRFFGSLHELDVPSPPRDFKNFTASGSMALTAEIALSASSLAGLSVHALIAGMILTLILLDKALALELAIMPVASRLVGDAVMRTADVKAPPERTGSSCVVPEATLVTVKIMGCSSIGSPSGGLLDVVEFEIDVVELGSAKDLEGRTSFDVGPVEEADEATLEGTPAVMVPGVL